MKWLMPPVPVFCVVFVSQPFLRVPRREEEERTHFVACYVDRA